MAASAAARQLVTEYNSIQQRINNMKLDFQQASKELFQEAAIGLFQNHPSLVAFGWTQYTPYFNDGEPCEFSANIDAPFIRFEGDEGGNDLDWDDEFCTYSYTTGYGATQKVCPDLTDEQKKKYAIGLAVIGFLGTFTEEQYKAMFDDHVKVVVNRDGIIVDEYEHD